MGAYPRRSIAAALRRDRGVVRNLPAAADPLGGTEIPHGVLGALRRRGGGRALPAELNAAASETLGRDLSTVRLHTDTQAATLADSVQAVAFTYGDDIYFSAGSYRPGEPDGQRIIAHELGHVGQSASSAAGQVGLADDPAEVAADRAAVGVIAALRRSRTSNSPGPAESHDNGRIRPGTIRRIARDALVPGQSYHLIVDGGHRVATFLGPDTVGSDIQYWFAMGPTRFYLRPADGQLVLDDAEWKQYEKDQKMAAQVALARRAGVTDEEMQWAQRVSGTPNELYFLVASLARWRPCAQNTVLPAQVVAAGIVGRPVFTIVSACVDLVRSGRAAPEAVLGIVTRYLTGPPRANLVGEFLGNVQRLEVSVAQGFIADSGRWMTNLMQLDNLLKLVLDVPDVARGLAALRPAGYVFTAGQTLLEIVRDAPTASSKSWSGSPANLVPVETRPRIERSAESSSTLIGPRPDGRRRPPGLCAT
ncbi:eCIS core domain-containing protein [Nakamurella lactea]|uniref:eCIS core domain-containing protein n=1 Tax=Nakamurella lactea TaxID=459515 RepID=UPI0003FF6B15|nr:DUF4157 domain-containing protein [Nakamurella lactea]